METQQRRGSPGDAAAESFTRDATVERFTGYVAAESFSRDAEVESLLGDAKAERHRGRELHMRRKNSGLALVFEDIEKRERER